MNVDTSKSMITVIAAIAMAAVVVISVIGIVVLAVVHDGALSSEAMDSFKQVLFTALGGGTVLGIAEKVTTATTANRAIAAGANVQGSPVNVTTSPASEPASDPAGADASVI